MSGSVPVRAAGGVLWREASGGVEVAVVHRPKYDDWSLPKGKLDTGELEVSGAVREVAEETGFTCVVGRGLGTSRYRVLDRGRDVPKTVRWWALQAVDGAFVPSEEVDELRWLPLPVALRTATTGREDGVLERFAACPPQTSTVLLVRHGRAGSRAGWAGEDDERLLDADGLRQAERLSHVLPLWQPTEVLSAPPLRCRATVEPLARRLGLPVEPDADLAEAAEGALPGRLRELGASGRTLVACSQGGVIGQAVGALVSTAGLEVADLRAPKGSVWALSFAAGALVDADRTDVPADGGRG